jgi:hypothetical protein
LGRPLNAASEFVLAFRLFVEAFERDAAIQARCESGESGIDLALLVLIRFRRRQAAEKLGKVALFSAWLD